MKGKMVRYLKTLLMQKHAIGYGSVINDVKIT